MDSQDSGGVAEEQLTRWMKSSFIPHKSFLGISDGHPLPASCDAAYADPKKWAAAVDREYDALVRSGAWKYVKRTNNMRPVPFKWTFRAKTARRHRRQLHYKARCVLRGDLQEPYEDFDPENLYAPVAAHETLHIFIAVAASHKLIPEGSEVSNTRRSTERIDIPILMEQPTNS